MTDLKAECYFCTATAPWIEQREKNVLVEKIIHSLPKGWLQIVSSHVPHVWCGKCDPRIKVRSLG